MADQTALGHTETAPPAGSSQGQARTHAGSPQGREQIAAVEHRLEEAIRAKPRQSVVMATGMGMLRTFLLWKERARGGASSWSERPWFPDLAHAPPLTLSVRDGLTLSAWSTSRRQDCLWIPGCRWGM